jgi:hypothetical protein
MNENIIDKTDKNELEYGKERLDLLNRSKKLPKNSNKNTNLEK